jgi:hypothetical protein
VEYSPKAKQSLLKHLLLALLLAPPIQYLLLLLLLLMLMLMLPPPHRPKQSWLRSLHQWLQPLLLAAPRLWQVRHLHRRQKLSMLPPSCACCFCRRAALRQLPPAPAPERQNQR